MSGDKRCCGVSLGGVAGLFRQQDGIPREGELRPRDFLLGVLVPVRQPGEAANPHDDNAVAGVHRHAGRGLGDRDVDPEAGTHRGDGRGVAGVQAGRKRPIPRHFADCLRGELGALDGAGARRGEHTVRQGKSKVNGTRGGRRSIHCFFLSGGYSAYHIFLMSHIVLIIAHIIIFVNSFDIFSYILDIMVWLLIFISKYAIIE